MENIKPLKELNKLSNHPAKNALILIILAAAGLAGNYFRITLFFGVDILFGSIAVLVALHIYGIFWGTLIALFASSYTYVLWGHPYAIVIFTCEALFVGVFLNRKTQNMIILDGIFWVFIGIPMVWLLYSGVMNMDSTAKAYHAQTKR